MRERRKEFGESEVEFSHITSAALPFLGNLSIALCLKSHLLVFQFLRFYLFPWSNFQFLSNLQFGGMSLFRGGAFTSTVVRGKSDKGDKPRKDEVQRCTEVCRGAQKGAQGGVQAVKGPGWQKAGPHGCPEVGKWKNGCGGHIEGTPTIG